MGRPRAVLGLLIACALVGGASFGSVAAQTATCDGVPITGTSGTEGNDVLMGTEGSDHIAGLGGSDSICALGGDDFISGGPGDDHLDGGIGIDQLRYDDFDQEAVTVSLSAGRATGGAGTDEIVVGSFENVSLNCSTVANDTIIGDEADNVIIGGSGNDSIVGNGGNDRLHGTTPSWGRTDAICWQSPDADVLDGGDGDDSLFGEAGSNDLDGGAGFDILHAGEGGTCTNGERYARCTSEDPPPPPAGCSDATDNDGDGSVDHATDADCASPDDPTETTGHDPACFDGLDNDGDGDVDHPEDLGCNDLEGDDEYMCPLCPPPSLTIRHRPRARAFAGTLMIPGGHSCARDRTIVLRKEGRRRPVGRTVTDDVGRWKISSDAIRGGFVAVARPRDFVDPDGDYVSCSASRSRTLQIG